MEFVVTTDLAKLQPQIIESNFEETKAWLQEALAPYASLVVSEDAIRSAKDDKANINRLKKTLDDKRKAVKKQWVEPYLEWESKVAELISMCDTAYANIDNQVKNFENQRKEEKCNELKAYFEESAASANIGDFLTFESVFESRWLNTTVKVENAKNEIDLRIQTTVDDLKTIYDLESEFESELLLDYANNHDLRRVLSRNKALAEMKAVTEARKKQEEKIPIQEEIKTTSKETESQKIYDLLLQLRLTEPQARRLKKYLAIEEIETVQSKMKEYKTK